MAEVTYRDAVAMAIAQEMRRDPNVVFLGEDIAAAGGVFKATVGLLDEFGPLRVRDTPISEQAILGAAMGAAMRPASAVEGGSRANADANAAASGGGGNKTNIVNAPVNNTSRTTNVIKPNIRNQESSNAMYGRRLSASF